MQAIANIVLLATCLVHGISSARSETGAVPSWPAGGTLGQWAFTTQPLSETNHARLSKIVMSCDTQIDFLRVDYTDPSGVVVPGEPWGGNGNDRPLSIWNLKPNEYVVDARSDTCESFGSARVCYILMHTNTGRKIECGTPHPEAMINTKLAGKAMLWMKGRYTSGRHHDAGIYSFTSCWIPIRQYF